MANARQEIDKAVLAKLNTATVLTTAKGGVFNTLAPKGALSPFVVFQAMSKIDEHSFNGRFANAVYMVKAVSRSQSPKEAQDVDTVIDSTMEDASLSITGFTPLLCRRESDLYLVEPDGSDLWHHIGGLYRIMADQT